MVDREMRARRTVWEKNELHQSEVMFRCFILQFAHLFFSFLPFSPSCYVMLIITFPSVKFNKNSHWMREKKWWASLNYTSTLLCHLTIVSWPRLEQTTICCDAKLWFLYVWQSSTKVRIVSAVEMNCFLPQLSFCIKVSANPCLLLMRFFWMSSNHLTICDLILAVLDKWKSLGATAGSLQQTVHFGQIVTF